MCRWIESGLRAVLLLAAIGMLPAGSAQAQKWSTAAAFPVPSEELYGAGLEIARHGV